jgi:hypothetical protein
MRWASQGKSTTGGGAVDHSEEECFAFPALWRGRSATGTNELPQNRKCFGPFDEFFTGKDLRFGREMSAF